MTCCKSSLQRALQVLIIVTLDAAEDQEGQPNKQHDGVSRGQHVLRYLVSH